MYFWIILNFIFFTGGWAEQPDTIQVAPEVVSEEMETYTVKDLIGTWSYEGMKGNRNEVSGNAVITAGEDFDGVVLVWIGDKPGIVQDRVKLYDWKKNTYRAKLFFLRGEIQNKDAFTMRFKHGSIYITVKMDFTRTQARTNFDQPLKTPLLLCSFASLLLCVFALYFLCSFASSREILRKWVHAKPQSGKAAKVKRIAIITGEISLGEILAPGVHCGGGLADSP